jgi:hypothetical protein
MEVTRNGTSSSNLHNAGTRNAGLWRIKMDSRKKAIKREHKTLFTNIAGHLTTYFY